jgi:hypothetical protein
MQYRRVLLGVSLALGLGACDGGGTTAMRDGGGGGTDATVAIDGGGSGPVDGGESFETRTLTMGPFNTPSGTERVLCASFDLGNEAAAMIRGIRTHLTEGSHHMIVYVLHEPPDPTARPCGSFEHGIGQSVFIAQQREAGLRYPDGAGYPIDAHATVGFELHFINYVSSDPIDIMGMVELDLVPDDGSLDEVELVFTGNLSLSLPPRTTTTVTSFHPLPASRVFGLTSHTHQLGEYATLHRGTSETDVGELLHESTSWADPPLDIFDPPLVFGAGEGLVLSCDFNNTTDRTVTFGTAFEDEMCFLWAYLIR